LSSEVGWKDEIFKCGSEHHLMRMEYKPLCPGKFKMHLD
jgi:hypothetical protein